jgi:cysteine synthase B
MLSGISVLPGAAAAAASNAAAASSRRSLIADMSRASSHGRGESPLGGEPSRRKVRAGGEYNMEDRYYLGVHDTMIYENILQTIGDTPLVRINQLNPNPRATILAKIEGDNPGGSVKDRIALKMIEQAEAEGALTSGKTIIEPTSGNTGIALAMIGIVRGYDVEIVMSEAVSIERRKMIRAFGATVTLTPAELGTDGAIMRARELVQQHPDKYFMPDQFSNEYNKIAHYKTTAEEIWKQTNGRIDHFVSAIGTSGTIMGVGKALKENNPRIRIVCAHPVAGHYIQGLKNMKEAIVPSIYDPSQIDETIMVETEVAFEMARQIIKHEGIFVGMSSGAAMYAAIAVAREIESGTIVAIFPDRGEKYLSTNLFPDE